MTWRLVGLVVASVSLGVPTGAQSGTVLVSAAASLTEVLQHVVRVYEARSADRVALNFGASNTLARQIRAGARVDLFISADEAQMNIVSSDILPGTRVNLLSNQLAIAVPDDRARTFASARDLLDPSIRRIAVGDPAAVPAGVYARQYLQQIGIWAMVQPKLIPAGSVRLALAAVENGAADAAVVYRTDVASAARTRLAFTVPAAEGPRIVYPAAIIRTGLNTAGARRFLDFLRNAEALTIFRQAGFLPIG
jgi:molybdate transport system substrate-binding protein